MKKSFQLCLTFRDHSYIISAKDWVDRSRKWSFLLMLFILISHLQIVGGSEIVQNYGDGNTWMVPYVLKYLKHS